MDATTAVAVSFLTLAFAQLWHVFNMRGRGSGFLRNEVTRNPFVWAALVVSTGLIVAAVSVPRLGSILRLASPGPAGWLLVMALSAIPWAAGQVAAKPSAAARRNARRRAAHVTSAIIVQDRRARRAPTPRCRATDTMSWRRRRPRIAGACRRAP